MEGEREGGRRVGEGEREREGEREDSNNQY